MRALCRLLEVSASGFYAWQARSESRHARRDRQPRTHVCASFEASHRRYGGPRIHEDLLDQGIRVSRKRVVRVMQEAGLRARGRTRYRGTTRRDPAHPVAANLLNRHFTAEAPNQRWVGDTTEVVIGSDGTLYLAAILDLFSRFVVGWAVSAANDRHLTITALQMALQRRGPGQGLLHHSDQGCTYTSADYQAVLQAQGITCSMNRTGDCYDSENEASRSGATQRCLNPEFSETVGNSRHTRRRSCRISCWSSSSFRCVTSRLTTTSGARRSHPRAVERGTPISVARVTSPVRCGRDPGAGGHSVAAGGPCSSCG